MKPVLYTCITDDRDGIPPLPFASSRLDYVLFRNPDEQEPAIDAGPWVVRPLIWQHPTDTVRTARWHKHHPTLCFPDHDYSIWMDATHWPVTDISWFPDWFLQDTDIACFPHFVRTSVGREAAEIIRVKLDDETTVRAQLARYREAGFTEEIDRQLYDTSIMVRRHCSWIKALSGIWWREIVHGSRRDQLSFTYCLWLLGMKCTRLAPGYSRHPAKPFTKRGSPYFDWKSHPPKLWISPGELPRQQEASV